MRKSCRANETTRHQEPTGARLRRLSCAAMVLAALLAVAAAPALAHGPNQPPHQSYKIGDLKLESGETIQDFAISYVTHGTLNAKKSNAILMVTAISGNHHRLDFLIGPGNSTAQPHMKF